ncbi:hypothetical protein LCGC14_1244870 [marine sediment metagenome]|uniref:HTH tetR-type domain-containing protein n=1 Tax=marine sediment metagenome TaxID=412755 RepID=A0A0F9P8U4_9ZZZZ|nr:TetR family transcriptional regulator [Methylophaga sp.]HEC58247.1 TetR family transcriptional regulator [Methylophaga sp.]
MARKTKEDSQLTRDLILNAAELIIYKKGMSYTTMADIADEAKMSRGAIYGHYKNKVEVAISMVIHAFESIEILKMEDGQTYLDYLYHQGILELHQAIEPSHIQRVFCILYALHDEDVELLSLRQDWENSRFIRIENCLLEAVAHNELPENLDSKLATLYLQTLLDGIFSTIYWNGNCPENKWELAEELYQIGFESMKTSKKFYP